jgi:hypothetical protein
VSPDFARILRVFALAARFGLSGAAATISAEVSALVGGGALAYALSGATAGVLVWNLTTRWITARG